jgi:glycosyltransferase involved in cell wall biosynthesis
MIGETKKISVCIPAFNRPEYLRETIKSVIEQSYQNIEVIISDDASPIDLSIIVREFNDQRIKYYKQEKNIGFIKNWNFCINKSNGEYIKILGDDDILNNNCIEDELKILTTNKVNFICSNYDTINENGDIIINKNFNSHSFRLLKKSGLINENELLKRYFLGKIRIGLPSAITFKKEIINEVGLFDEKIGCPADIDMWMRIINKNILYYNDNFLLKMRRHSNNLSDQIQKKFFPHKEDLDILYKHYKKITNINILNKILIFIRYFKMTIIDILDKRFIVFNNKKLVLGYLFKLYKIFL